MPDPNDSATEKQRSFTTLWTVSMFGWQVAVSVIVGLIIDSQFGTRPWGTLLLAMLGLVSAVIGLIRAGLGALKKEQR